MASIYELHYFLYVINLISSIVSDEFDTVVTLLNPSGSKVKGQILETFNNRKFFAYHDIPYAESTEGKNRFQLPIPKKGWSDIRDCTENKVICLQVHHSENTSEDCLVLSVFTASNPQQTHTKLPVLLLIHGGYFYAGVGSQKGQYPVHFIDEDIVVVTINYRLGLFGFLTTNDEIIPANLGLKDQELSIKWVYENIEAFGGDQNQIVIGGHSAGAAAVSYHILNYKQPEYFNGAIQVSGSALAYWAHVVDSRKKAFDFAKKIDSTFSENCSVALLRILQNTSADELLKLYKTSKLTDFGPSTDGGDEFSIKALEAVNAGRFKMVPILSTVTSKEWERHIKPVELHNPYFNSSNDYILRGLNIPDRLKSAVVKELRELYMDSDFDNFNETLIQFESVTAFGRPAIKFARSAAKYLAHNYIFIISYRTSTVEKLYSKNYSGLSHADDLELLFTKEEQWKNWTETDKLVSKKLVRLWTNFIKYGNPMPAIDPLFDNVTLPAVTPEGEVPYLDVDVSLEIHTNPFNFKRLEAILDQYIVHPASTY